MSHNVNVFDNEDKYKRSSNFSSKEVHFLIQLVDKRKEIIESKKTDRLSSQEKVKAWMEIEEEFNEVFVEFRSLKVLRTKYENLKKTVKKKLPANVSNISVIKVMKTNENMFGTDASTDIEYTDDDESIQNMNDSNVDTKPIPVGNEIDGLDAEEAEQFSFETLLIEQQAQQSDQKLPKQSKSQTSHHTTEKRKQPLDIWDEVAHTKIKKLNLEMNILQEDWKLRKTKLDLELENVRTENKLREDKLKLEIELLKEKLENKNSLETL